VTFSYQNDGQLNAGFFRFVCSCTLLFLIFLKRLHGLTHNNRQYFFDSSPVRVSFSGLN